MRDGLLYLGTPGIGLSVRSGVLIVKTAEGEAKYRPQPHALRCVIMANGGYVSTDALAWHAREHVALLIAHAGEFLTIADCTAGRHARRELALRRRQLECVHNPASRLAAARAIVALKLDTLRLDPDTHDAALASLAIAPTLQDVLAREAAHAAGYWRRWKGFKLAFRDGSTSPFNSRARSWRTGRLGETGKQFSNRFALDPINAMLNYSGAIVVAQCARAATGLGLDPAFGVLHSARPGMQALAWDIFELLRARLETAVFAFAGSYVFEQSEFKTVFDPKSHIKFAAPLARDLAGHVLQRVPFASVVKTCRTVAGLF